MQRQMLEAEVAEFFRGKTVLVLGSGPGVNDLTPEFMDGFDVIVRSNNYKVFNSCRRTDVFYSFLGGSIKKPMADIIADGARFVFCRNPDTEFLGDGERGPGKSFDARPVYEARKDWFEIPYFIQSARNYRLNYALIRRLLTTGTSSIIDVLRYNPAILSIAGFDFFTTAIHNGDEPCRPNPGHDFEGEYKLVRMMWKGGVVKVSPTMEHMFSRSITREEELNAAGKSD